MATDDLFWQWVQDVALDRSPPELTAEDRAFLDHVQRDYREGEELSLEDSNLVLALVQAGKLRPTSMRIPIERSESLLIEELDLAVEPYRPLGS